MQSLRRLTAIVLNVLLIQASLSGYPATCAQPGEAMGSAASAAGAMMHVADASLGAERACREAAAEARSSLPCAPGGCAIASACAAPALTAGTTAPGARASSSAGAWGDPERTREGLRRAPELPPPRA